MVVRYDRTHFSLAESSLLGGHLTAARRVAGASIGSLARRLRVPEVTLRAYEAGRARFPLRLLFAAARALRTTPYMLLVGRPDKVVNPWGPTLSEWQRVRREWESPEASHSEEVERDRWEPPLEVEVEIEQRGEETDEGTEGPFALLTGEEAARAIAFLDEPGPAGRMEEGDEERW